MPAWINLPADKLVYQPDQQAFLAARRLRQCRPCSKPGTPKLFDSPPHTVCPDCGHKGIRCFDKLIVMAGRRYGKGLALDTPIPTPLGWRTMAEIAVGDLVFDANGKSVPVLAISGINHLPCYRVSFSDGQSLVADESHQWLIWSRKARKQSRRHKRDIRSIVTTTTELIAEIDNRDAIPLTGPLQYAYQDALPVKPYTLGAWLGDGHSASAIITAVDHEILDNIELDGYAAQPYNYPEWYVGRGTSQHRDVISGRFTGNDSLQSSLKQLGVLKNKHVPREYLESSIDQRLALLQGLMDTDGYCSVKGQNEFTSTNSQLAEAVFELATGLGWRPTKYEGRAMLYGKDCGPKWRVFFWANLPVYRLTRKRQRQHLGLKTFFPVRYITAVEPITSVPTKCIEVESKDGLYLAGRGCVPTHNSKFGSIAGAEEATIPDTIGWACAPTNPKLHRYVIPAFQQLIPREWVAGWNNEYLDLRLKNGSLIHFQTLEDPDQGRGQGLDWLWIDEVCELTKDHWDVIRPSLGDKQGGAFFTTSPRSFDWVYEELYKPAEQSEPGYWGLLAKTSDNPIFQTVEGVEFLAREKRIMSDTMYRQEYEADFVTFTGAVYGTLVDSQILQDDDAVRNFLPEWPQVDPGRQVLVGLDTGADHPFGAVKAITTDRGIIIVGEYLHRHRSFAEHKHEILKLAGNPNTRWSINKNEAQPRIELAQAPTGIFCAPAENDIVAGTERVKAWLYQKQMWFVKSHCPQTIRQMQTYRWAESKQNDGQVREREKVFKKDDELPDCIRYLVMTYPRLPNPELNTETLRDIKSIPEHYRPILERVRKLDNPPKEDKEPSFALDFYA